MNDRLGLDRQGRLILGGVPLKDGEPLDVWLITSWWDGTVVKHDPNWLIRVADQDIGGLGLRVRRQEAPHQE